MGRIDKGICDFPIQIDEEANFLSKATYQGNLRSLYGIELLSSLKEKIYEEIGPSLGENV